MSEPKTVREILGKLRDAVNAAESDLTATFQYVIEGEGVYRLVIDNGECDLVDGEGEATSTTFAAVDDALLIFGGKTDAMKAFMEGRMRVEGDLIAMSALTPFMKGRGAATAGGAPVGYIDPEDSPALLEWRDQATAQLGSLSTLREVAADRGFFIGAAVPTPANVSGEVLLSREFNGLGAENAFKWSHLAKKVGNYDFSTADLFVDYAQQHDMRLRGHTLIWGRGGRPHDLETIIRESDAPEETLRQLMRDHIETVLTRYRGKVAAWDVVNEPMAYSGIGLDKNVFFDNLGEEFVDLSFHLAREFDPDAELVLNEQISASEYGGPSAVDFLGFVRRLLDRGAPVDGVGLQGHMLTDVPDPDALLAYLREIEQLGLFIEFTEMDMRVGLFGRDADPLGSQAAAYHRLGEVFAAVPAVRGAMFWGATDAETWLDHFPPFDAGAPNQPLLFNQHLDPKPAYYAFLAGLATRPLQGHQVK